MSECICEAVLLGRESVQGTANADSLAALVRLLTRRGGDGRKCRLRCSKDGIEIRSARRQDDEGFESDDDTVSQTSSDSNSSSLEDRGRVSVAGATDSANSSGASDNDDADHSLTRSRTSASTPTSNTTNCKPKKQSGDDIPSKEIYAFSDVAFCHTDPAFPRVLVLVIKKKTKSTNKDEVETTPGLEAVVFQCKSVENLREVCASYKEFSRRLKMDLQFRYPHRRKDCSRNNSSHTLYRNVFNDLQKSMDGSATSNSPFFKTWITHVSDKSQSVVSDLEPQLPDSNKYNLVQRTDEDGVTHIEVSKAVDAEFTNSLKGTDEYSGSSSIISISTPDVGNLFLSPTSMLPIDPYLSLPENPTDPSEIDGVICADVESSPTAEGKVYKTSGNPSVSEEVVKDKRSNTNESVSSVNTPPQRPQRGKYIKKNGTKTKDTQTSDVKSKSNCENDRSSAKTLQDSNKQSVTHERVVRGQFVRVNVENSAASSSVPRTGSRLFGGEAKPTGQMLSYPVWSLPTKDVTKRSRTREDDADYRSGRGEARGRTQQRRSRSSGPPRRTASPQRLAYRYIEHHPKPLSNRFFGKLKEIASINNASVYVGTLSKRRNSSGDLATAQFYQYLEPSLKTSPVSKSSSNLKSVIKKKNCTENLEPKKVTFSAYATVQVVD